MLKVEKGGVYRAARVRSGSGERGDWELVAIADEQNDKRKLTVFASNAPCGCVEGQQVKIVEITSVKVGWKKDQNGQWKPETTVEAVLNPITSEIDGFEGMDDVGSTPWGDTESDWDKLPL